MELRKVLKSGWSAAITLPRKYVEPMQLRPGDYVEILYGPNDTLVIRKHQGLQRAGVKAGAYGKRH